MSKPFIDSNVILYLLAGDTRKADRAEAILAARGVVSVQVLNEVASVCTRKLKMSWDEIADLLAAIKTACNVVPLTLETHELAISFCKRFQLSFYDALICASAVLAGAGLIYSEDMHNGLDIEGVRVVNPFR